MPYMNHFAEINSWNIINTRVRNSEVLFTTVGFLDYINTYTPDYRECLLSGRPKCYKSFVLLKRVVLNVDVVEDVFLYYLL